LNPAREGHGAALSEAFGLEQGVGEIDHEPKGNDGRERIIEGHAKPP